MTSGTKGNQAPQKTVSRRREEKTWQRSFPFASASIDAGGPQRRLCGENRVNCGNPLPACVGPARQSAAKLLVHQGKVQRLLEGSSPLNNQLERPALAASLRGDEIVHASAKAEERSQPFYDTLIRTAGTVAGNIGDTTALFTSNGARSDATTNLINGATLPSDQSHVVLALRVFTWYRNPMLRVSGVGTGEVAFNGDYNLLAPFLVGGAAVGNAPATIHDVYRNHWQTEEQLQRGAFAA